MASCFAGSRYVRTRYEKASFVRPIFGGFSAGGTTVVS